MPPTEDKPDAMSVKKLLNSKWAVWVSTVFAVLVLCMTAAIAFSIQQRAQRPVAMHSPLDAIEARYGLADLQVNSSDGLGVDAGSTPVAGPGQMASGMGMPASAPVPPAPGAAPQLSQPAAPKIGPAPSASEAPALQPVTNTGTNALQLQTGINVLGVEADAAVELNTVDATQLGL